MTIFNHPNLRLVRAVDISDLVLKTFDSVVTLNIVVALVLFNLDHFRLDLLVMGLILVVHFIFMVLLSLRLVFLELLDLIVKLFNLGDFLLVRLIMVIGVNLDLFRCRFNMGLKLSSRVLRTLKVVLVVVEVTLDVSDHRKFLVQREQSGLHPVNLNVTLS
jgi:hypothetical protein